MMRIRNLFLAVLLIFMFAVPTRSAWLFDGTSDYVTLADNAALDLPDGDWTIAGWVLVNANAGDFAYYPAIGAGGGGFFEIIVRGTGKSNPNSAQFFSIDDDGTSINANANISVWDGTWQHLLIQRSGNTVSVYVDNALQSSATNASFDAVTVAGLTFGPDEDTKFFDGSLAEWAKWDRALSDEERASLAQGFSPSCFPGFSWYPPMINIYQELAAGIAVTNNGTVPTAHPRIIYCGE